MTQTTTAPAKMQVPLLDFKIQFKTFKPEVMAVFESILDSQQFIGGPHVKALEAAIAHYSQTVGGVAMSSGTDALLCSLMALGIGPGDEVITSPYTFFATAGSITRVGAKPVFVDIEHDTFNIDVSRISAAITPRTRAIMPVHLFGQTSDMDPIMDLARKHNLLVIEDAAQSIGAKYKGRQSGSIGDVGCFSFYPSKNLGGAGDGGMVVTQNPALAERITIFRDHGAKPAYFHQWVGGNFRLDALQCAYLLVKLKFLESWSDARRRNAAHYQRLLGSIPQIQTPVIAPYNTSNFNQYVIRAQNRDQLKAYLAQEGVGSAIYYPVSLHEQVCFKNLGYKKGDFPVSELTASESLAIPVFPELTGEQIEYVASRIAAFYRG